METKIIVIVVKRAKNELKITMENIVDNLDSYYRLLDCETIDIVKRTINGHNYEFVVDGEYLLNEKILKPPVAVFEGNGEEAIFGSLVITGEADQEGNLTSVKLPNAMLDVELAKCWYRNVLEQEESNKPNLNPIYQAIKYSI